VDVRLVAQDAEQPVAVVVPALLDLRL